MKNINRSVFSVFDHNPNTSMSVNYIVNSLLAVLRVFGIDSSLRRKFIENTQAPQEECFTKTFF